MAKIVEVPNLGNVEFPDTMSDEAINQTISKQLNAPKSVSDIVSGNFPAAKRFQAGYQQLPQTLQDPYLGLNTSNIGKVGNAMFGMAEKAPGLIEKSMSYISHPFQKYGEKLSDRARTLMQSALKPTLQQSQSGKAETAINTLLERELPVTQGTVETLSSNIGSLNEDIANQIAGSTGTVKKSEVLKRLGDLGSERGLQVAPESDINAINDIKRQFLQYNKGMYNPDVIPVQTAQGLKQGTYSSLSNKYGKEMGAGEEAQKALARGLKEEIATEMPIVANLNKQESNLLDTLDVTERRMFMTLNKDPFGWSMLATHPVKTAAMLMDRSPAFKSLAAIQVNKLAKALKPSTATTSNSKLPLFAGRLQNQATQNQNEEQQ
jgi:hypothetical protein